jgi:hypothetical protein
MALLAGACASPALAARVYTMHRPGLRVKLEVLRHQIFPTHVWVLRRCSDGFEGSAGLSLEEPGEGIPIHQGGRFEFKWLVGDGYWMRIRLTGRVRRRTITGFYMEWEREGSRAICGTGEPGDRALHFTARRASLA